MITIKRINDFAPEYYITEVITLEKTAVNLIPLAEIGGGRAEITDNSVDIEIAGINGSLKAWLTGGDAVPIGNIVGGRLRREISTANHSGILITQSGRQMLYAEYRSAAGQASPTANMPPFIYGSFKWRKITSKKFAAEDKAVKYILSNRRVYESFKRYGYYWFGENGSDRAIALKCAGAEDNPLSFLPCNAELRNGCRIICIKKDGGLYTVSDG